MIDLALAAICRQLNDYLRAHYQLAEDLVAPGPVLNLDGSVPPQTENKLAVTLYHVSGNDDLTLSVCMTACFGASNYLEGLKILSDALSWIKANPVLGGLPQSTSVRLQWMPLDLAEAARLRAMLGAKSAPCIFLTISQVPLPPPGKPQ